MGSIPLRIDEPTGVRRERWPVRWGVPFPQGRLASPETVRLCNEAGREIPCAASVSAWWPDRSVKWLLLQFQVTLAPQTSLTYTVEYGSEARRTERASPLRVEEDGDRLVVQTGLLAFSVSRSRFSGIEEVGLNGREMLSGPIRAHLADGDGVVYQTDGASEVVIEEQTSERVTLRAKGRHRREDGRTLFDYLLRISAYPDLPWIELDYTFLNTEDAEYTTLREVTLSVPVRADGKTVGACGAGRKVYRFEEPFHFTHDHVIEKYGIFAGSPIYRADGQRVAGVGLYDQALASGWLDVSGSQSGLCVSLRDFVWTFPKEAAWREGEVAFSIWPSRSEPLKLHQGMSRTGRFLLHFHEGDAEDARVNEVAAAFSEPLLPWNGPWYIESGAFGDVLPHRPDRYPRLERALRDIPLDARNRRSLGALDYGDSVNQGTGSQGGFSSNNEHDVSHGHLLQFVRTGERIPFQVADAGIWHTMDVDIVHHTTRSPVEQGGQRIHGHGHIQYDAEGYPDVSAVPSHMWTEGLLEYHYLTGHPRPREIAVGIADCLLKMVGLGWAQPPYHSSWHSCRDSGWPLIALAAVYEATGDDRYRVAMRRVFEAMRAAQDPAGGWSMELGFHVGHCPFQMGVGLTGVGRYHEVTDDAAAREVFLKGVAFLAGDAMRFPDGAWVYVTTPDYRNTYRSDTPLEPFGYAFRITKDRGLVEAGLKGWTRSLDLRASLRFLRAADEAGLLEDI